MVYVDTSAFVPLFIREPKTEPLLDWLEASHDALAISDWTLVEFASASAIKIRTGQADPALVKKAAARAREFAADYCAVATPGRSEYHRAAELASDPALRLRAGDALHLALAESLKAGSILCLDQGMIESAEALGMHTVQL
jgi:hypothetical protein